MYKEFDKYKTGEKVNVVGVIVNTEPKQEINLLRDGYRMTLGDIINDFIDHKNKPWYKRDKLTHDMITKKYIKLLEDIKFDFTL